MKRLILVMLLTAAICSQASAATTAREYPGWKIPQHFEVSLTGFEESYQPAEAIEFQVVGKSDLLEVGPTNGFDVKVKVYDFPRTKSFNIPSVVYDSKSHNWQITVAAPDDKSKSYEIQVHFYCKDADSPCAATYGRSAQVEKIIPIQVQ